ncbi:MAG: HYExAFE family protein [Phycisphaerae bacterium]|nr:HYExAFE family protein [Phycisphaerae bacterium]
MLRNNHYEAAFEDFIRSRGWPYVPVDEQRRAIFGGARIKSFDFIVYRPGESAWIVDSKGRKMETEPGRRSSHRQNWVTREDLEDLRRWHGVFGERFEPVLVFVYWYPEWSDIGRDEHVHLFRNRWYHFGYISASQYDRYARQRSKSWDTVFLPADAFRTLFRPLN